MQAEEGFKTRFNAVVMSLRAWSENLADVAEIERTESVVAWRLAMAPRITGGCPFEFVLRSDAHYDIAIDTEVFPDCPIEDLQAFPVLLRSITDGAVTICETNTAATGTSYSVETTVAMPNAAPWRRVRYNSSLLGRDAPELVARCRLFNPYRR